MKVMDTGFSYRVFPDVKTKDQLDDPYKEDPPIGKFQESMQGKTPEPGEARLVKDEGMIYLKSDKGKWELFAELKQ